MNHRPILIDVTTLTLEDDMARDTVVAEQVDISAILLEVIGDDADAAISFAEDPSQAEWPDFYERLAAHPSVACSDPQIDGSFDLAAAIDPELSRRSSDEEIAAAWKAWRTAAVAAGGVESYADLRWQDHARDLQAWLGESMPSDASLVAFARILLTSREMTAAILAAAASPERGAVEALRTCAALSDALGAEG